MYELSPVSTFTAVDNQTKVVPLLIRIIPAVALCQVSNPGIKRRHEALVNIEICGQFSEVCHFRFHLPQLLMP